MGILDRIRSLGRSRPPEPTQEAEHECLHGVLIARWADAADMGDESKATEFTCQSCDEHFTPDEAAEVRQRALDRLRR